MFSPGPTRRFEEVGGRRGERAQPDEVVHGLGRHDEGRLVAVRAGRESIDSRRGLASEAVAW
jgi:hypothetical protein